MNHSMTTPGRGPSACVDDCGRCDDCRESDHWPQCHCRTCAEAGRQDPASTFTLPRPLLDGELIDNLDLASLTSAAVHALLAIHDTAEDVAKMQRCQVDRLDEIHDLLDERLPKRSGCECCAGCSHVPEDCAACNPEPAPADEVDPDEALAKAIRGGVSDLLDRAERAEGVAAVLEERVAFYRGEKRLANDAALAYLDRATKAEADVERLTRERDEALSRANRQQRRRDEETRRADSNWRATMEWARRHEALWVDVDKFLFDHVDWTVVWGLRDILDRDDERGRDA